MLTSTHDKVFSAGGNLDQFAAEVPIVHKHFGTERFPELFTLIMQLGKPTICAANGHVLAGALGVALACDLIVATGGAKLGIPEVKRSLVAAGGALLRLPRRIPYHVAMELALTGDTITAERGYELGFVNRVVERGDAVDTALALAAAIELNAPLALAASKRIIMESPDWSREEEFDRQAEIAGPVFTSEDAREGATAFTEKRDPVWKGR